MIEKNFSKDGSVCEVTFRTPADLDAANVSLVGGFNGWNPSVTLLERTESGEFAGKVKFRTGGQYRFRYFVDGCGWLTDEQADGLEPNRFGSVDSVLDLSAPTNGAKKTATKKTAAKAKKAGVKTAAKKQTARKTTAKKAATKKAGTKKTATKKTAAKKAASKTAAARTRKATTKTAAKRTRKSTKKTS